MRLFRKDDLPRLKAVLVENGFRFEDEETFTTAAVAAALGVAEATVRKWERDGLIPTVPRDTNGRRLYRPEDVDRMKVALADLDRRDREVLDAEGLVTREQAQEMLGIGHRAMQRLIAKGEFDPVWIILPSSGRRRQCFTKEGLGSKQRRNIQEEVR